MKYLLLSCCVFLLLGTTQPERKELPSKGKRVVLRSIQASEAGKVVSPSAYRLASFTFGVDTVEVPLTSGVSSVYPNTRWLLYWKGREYHVDVVWNYVRYTDTYDVHLDFRPQSNSNCLDVSYPKMNGDPVLLTWNSPHGTVICQGLEFIPVKKGASRKGL